MACQLSPVFSNNEISANQFRLSFPVVIPPLGSTHYSVYNMPSQQEEGTCTRANVQFINSEPVKR